MVCVLCICGTPREKLNIMSVMYFKRITEFDRLKCLGSPKEGAYVHYTLGRVPDSYI